MKAEILKPYGFLSDFRFTDWWMFWWKCPKSENSTMF